MIPDDIVFQAVWAQLWQATLVMVAVGLAVRSCCKRRPHLAYTLWMLVLVKCVTPPLWASPTGIFSWTRSSDAAPTTEAASLSVNAPWQPAAIDDSPPIQAIASGNDNDLPKHDGDATAGATVPSTVPSNVAEAGSTSKEVAALNASRVLGLAWLSGAALYVVVATRAVLRVGRRLRNGRTVSAGPLIDQVVELSRRLGMRRQVRVVVVPESLGPLTYGWLRPTIVLPEALIAGSTPNELAPLLAHEMVHVRRGDAFAGLLQMFVQCLWWFHPLVWWANRRIGQAREQCCDEEVVAGLALSPAGYARILVTVLERQRQLAWLPAFPGVRSFEVTKQRLEHIMFNSARFHARMPRRQWLVVLTGCLLLAPGAKLGRSQSRDDDPLKPVADESARATNATLRRVTNLISPDGKRIAYGQIAVGPAGEQRVRIIVGDHDGGNRRALPIDAETVDEVCWYGNDRLAYVTEHGQDGYFLIDLDGKTAGRLTMPAGCDSFFHQCLSPDGRWIAYCGSSYADVPAEFTDEDARRKYLREHEEIKAEHGLFVVDLEKQAVKQLLNETVANLPAWSFDSKFLAAPALGVARSLRDRRARH